MGKSNNTLKSLLSSMLSQTIMSWTAIAGAAVVAIAVVWMLVRLNKDDKIEITKSDKIDITPAQIESLKSIGQWEFLSISDEEMIDTVRHGFFSDDELVRIYYGTVRLGIDMNDTSDDWITSKGDSVYVTLPPIKLLDQNFIDEGRTKSFFESGKWSQADRADLYERAKVAMKKRCITPANVRSAEQNATTQFDKVMRSLGIKNAAIRFDNTQK